MCSNYSSQADADSNSNLAEMVPTLWSAVESAGCSSGAGLMLCGGGSFGGGFNAGSTEGGGGVQANFSAPILLSPSQPVYDATRCVVDLDGVCRSRDVADACCLLVCVSC
jgi:hypothetical protein